MRELALFAGSGGGILGGHLLGWKTVAACEIEDYPRETLLRRQFDGILPRFPIWDDIRTLDGTQFRGRVDIVSGGFPCQDISAAGKGDGITGSRSGLWKEMHRIIGEVRPRYAFMENSPLLTSRGLGTVLGDLAEIGYDAEWCVLGADDVGAPHKRKRIWILAYSSEKRLQRSEQPIPCREERDWEEAHGSVAERSDVEISPSMQCNSGAEKFGILREMQEDGAESNNTHRSSTAQWWGEDPAERDDFKSQLGRVAHGVASRLDLSGLSPLGYIPRVETEIRNRVDRLKAIGNGQVPAVAAVAFLTLYKRIFEDGNE